MLNITTTAKSNFTRLDNTFLSNPNISIKAKGLLGQILSFPPTWKLSVSGLTKIFSDGKYAIGKAFAELAGAGYIVSYNARSERGCYASPKYGICETPLNEQMKKQLLENLVTASSDFNVERSVKNTNFTIISNKLFRNNTLSMQEKGMLCVILSLSQKWKLSAHGLTRLCSNGITSIGNTLEKLESIGILKRSMLHNSKGRFQESVYSVDINGGYEAKSGCDIAKKQLAADSNTGHSRKNVEDTIAYANIVKEYPHDGVLLETIVNTITETLASKSRFQRINQGNILTDTVKERFVALDKGAVVEVLGAVRKSKAAIKNVKNYIMTALYNVLPTGGAHQNNTNNVKKMHNASSHHISSYADLFELEVKSSSFNVEELDELDMERYRK